MKIPQEDENNESYRLTIAAIVVASATAILLADKIPIPFPSILTIPAGILVISLLVSGFIAFLYILARGYSLRYGKVQDNFIDKKVESLYNYAVKSYLFTVIILALAYMLGTSVQGVKSENLLGYVGLAAVGIVFYLLTKGSIKGIREGLKEIYLLRKNK